MNTNVNALLGALAVASGPLMAAPVLFPNGDFSTADGASWTEVSDVGEFAFAYPATGGNPDGYFELDQIPGSGGFGILVANEDQVIDLTSLGLTTGQIYKFSVDMIMVEGFNMGGFKLDFFSNGVATGSTGDLVPQPIAGGFDWETYDFLIQIPPGTDGIKAVLVHGLDTIIGYDNVRVDNTPATPETTITDGDFEEEFSEDFWAFEFGQGTFFEEFPSTGGNPGGHGVIDGSVNDGGFGVFVAKNNEILPLSWLGLEAGKSYQFSQDMKVLGGSSGRVGGLKIEFYNAVAYNFGGQDLGSSGDMFPQVIGDGSTWETYDFVVSIPGGATGIKVVPLGISGSIVGFDNVTVDPTPVIVNPSTGIPNGDFEEGFVDWVEGGAPNTTFSYPATGGNPDGHAVLTNDGGGYGILIANGNSPMSLESLGLTAGQGYVFSQDMTIFSGSNIGGVKVEFYNGGSQIGITGDLYPALIGDGSTWETYDFEVFVPSSTTGIKIVPLWGSGSSVGFDNFEIDPTPIPVSPIVNADFRYGGAGWVTFQGGGSTTEYFRSGGNPDGYGVIDFTGVGYVVLVANGNSIIRLEDLALTAGNTYLFTQDMILESGSTIGGLKIEFYSGAAGNGDSGDIYPALIGDGSSWQTYSFPTAIPEGTDGIKIVPLGAAGSRVGYDNIAYSTTPVSGGNDYAAWIGGFPGVGALTGFNDDADGDGVPNGLENLFGTDPSVFSAGVAVGGKSGSTFTFTHPQSDSPASDVGGPLYSWSADLAGFNADGATAGGSTVTFTASPNTPVNGTTTVTATVTGAPLEKLFIRVGATQAVN